MVRGPLPGKRWIRYSRSCQATPPSAGRRLWFSGCIQFDDCPRPQRGSESGFSGQHEDGIDGLPALSGRALFEMNMPFGKHKNTPIEDLPSNYVRWLRSALQDLDGDSKKCLDLHHPPSRFRTSLVEHGTRYSGWESTLGSSTGLYNRSTLPAPTKAGGFLPPFAPAPPL